MVGVESAKQPDHERDDYSSAQDATHATAA